MKSFEAGRFTFLNYTDMGEEMSKTIWKCRNLPEVRKWMVNQKLIPLSDHQRFVNQLHNNIKKYYFCVLENNELIGSVNIDFETEYSVERGIYLHPAHWGKKYSSRICKDLYRYLFEKYGIIEVNTKVLKDNAASNALESSLGASKVKEDSQFNFYRCRLPLSC